MSHTLKIHFSGIVYYSKLGTLLADACLLGNGWSSILVLKTGLATELWRRVGTVSFSPAKQASARLIKVIRFDKLVLTTATLTPRRLPHLITRILSDPGLRSPLCVEIAVTKA